jgi:UDPglucose 6-dehydrogenase/GDP-mannose 6-dehydrogenase
MNVAVVGTGYVGLVSGVCLAAGGGHNVVCVDLRREVVDGLNEGRPHIHENGLPDLLKKVRAAGTFSATLDLAAALDSAEIVLVAVGTPSTDGRIDLTYIRDVARQIGKYIRTRDRFLSVAIKSTVVPGTTDTTVRQVIEESSGKRLGDFGLGMNPEFLREGNAVEDFMEPDRIVLGHEDAETLRLLEELYRPWNCEKLAVNTRTAEMIKYSNNCLLATQISAVNELANVCAAVGGIDVRDVMRGVHLDERWSPITESGRIEPKILTYLLPGCGFGGSCFPKDVQALRTLGRDNGLPMSVLQAVLDVNDRQPLEVIQLLEHALDSFKGRTILVLGLAFKPDTDDVRESASIHIIRSLLEAGANVIAHDPVAMPGARVLLEGSGVTFIEEWKDALDSADAVVVATKWAEYARLAAPEIAAKLRGRVLIDARRMFEPEAFAGATYLTIGRRIPSENQTT